MAMETNTTAMPTGIRPIERPQGPQTAGIQRRGAPAASPFAPRTDVDLQNSVADVANLLSKIASTKEEAMDQLSPQLQKLIDNIMQQSFSLEATLAEGLGTTLENQRFAIDQMFTLARMLHQMGTLAEQGKPAALNEQLQALLANFKDLVALDEGKDMTPIMLHKLAFEVLDGKQAEELPEMMQYVLAQQGMSTTAAAPQAESDAFGFMKQLMDYLMPRPSEDEPAVLQGQNTQTGTAEESAQGETRTAAEGRPGESVKTQDAQEASGARDGMASQVASKDTVRDGASPRQTVAQGETSGETARQQSKTVMDSQDATKLQEPVKNQGQAQQAERTSQPGQTEQSAAQGKSAQPETASTRRGGESNAQIYAWENDTEEAQQPETPPDGIKPQDPFAELMRKGLERMRGRLQQQPTQPQQNEQGEPAAAPTFSGRMAESPEMQNSPRTMETMKQLATLLLTDAELTQDDERLLTEFVNNEQSMLSEREAKELQMLLRLCEKNIPASVRQSAQQKGMEDMPRLWAFMELCDLANIRERDAKTLKKASRSLSDFASMMKHSMLPENGRTAEGHRSMSFMTPLYMSEDMQKPYPAYIHVYDEEQKDESGGQRKKETWIRVCLLTDNIGAVDVSFRIYEDSNLDVRIYFSERENIEEFRDYMDEFRASFEDKPLTLMSVKVGVAGVKT